MKTDIQKLIRQSTLIIIAGPTASGKTAASLELAKNLDIEIISADSRQIYKYLDIGTAKPTKEELNSVPHHFIDILEPDAYYSAGMFGNEAEEKACGIFERGKIPVVCGGAGLYIKALSEGFFDEQKPSGYDEIREELNFRYRSEGIEQLYSELREADPESAEKNSDMNPQRILRALEYYHATGEKFSDMRERSTTKRNFNAFYYAIMTEREKLYKRINRRAEHMWKNGLIEETEKVLNMGFSRDLNSLNTVGYKECISYMDGNSSEKDALALMQQNTRRYAKRQMTWFRKVPGIKWLSGNATGISFQILKDLENNTSL